MQSPILLKLVEIAETTALQGQKHQVIFAWSSEGREFCGHTWEEYFSQIVSVSEALHSFGVRPGSKVLVILPTSFEWDLIEKSCFNLFANLLALDETVSIDSLQDVLSTTKPQFVLASVQAQEKLRAIQLRIPSLNWCYIDLAVLFNRRPRTGPSRPADFPHRHAELLESASDAPATVVFTSGTSGNVRGVSYSQNQILQVCEQILAHEGGLGARHRVIAWLPMAPLFQRVVNLGCLLLGSQIYYFYPPKEIAQALRKVRPTFFVAVPRFYEKLYHEIQSKIERSKFLPKRIQKLLERWALQRLFPMGAILLSGSAALSTDTQKFFERSGLKILEAYGLTECLLPIAISTPRANRSGSVGKLLYGNQWMLDAESQLLVKGEFLANGYVDGSADRWRSDGYFETGDLISLDAEGFVFIKGRKAFVLKLSTGKKVMRTQIESRFQFRENVDQFCIFGNDKPYLIGLLSLQKAGVSEEWLKQLRSYLVEFNSQVPSHEQVWKVLILDRPLSLAADELTVNLKLRYNKIEEKFKVDLNRLYGDPKPEVLTWLERQAL